MIFRHFWLPFLRPAVVYVSSGSNTLVVGIIAAVSVILASGLSGFVAWKVATSAGRTARELAKEDRRQTRIQDAYLTIHLYVDKWARYAQWRARSFRPAGELEPELPAVSEAAAALSALVASDEVEAAMTTFNTLRMAFRTVVGEHDDAIAVVQSLLEMPSDVAARTTASDNARRASGRVAAAAAALGVQAEIVHQLMRQELASG
jgi:hypothetical protein